MDYILKITTRYGNSEDEPSTMTYGCKTYNEACKKMVEELEKKNRQIMATDLTNVTGYTILLNEWLGGNKYRKVAVIQYDLAL